MLLARLLINDRPTALELMRCLVKVEWVAHAVHPTRWHPVLLLECSSWFECESRQISLPSPGAPRLVLLLLYLFGCFGVYILARCVLILYFQARFTIRSCR